MNVFFSAEDGGWIADIPELDACSAFGRTPVDAVTEVERARDAWIAAALKGGKPVPEPGRHPGQAL